MEHQYFICRLCSLYILWKPFKLEYMLKTNFLSVDCLPFTSLFHGKQRHSKGNNEVLNSSSSSVYKKQRATFVFDVFALIRGCCRLAQLIRRCRKNIRIIDTSMLCFNFFRKHLWFMERCVLSEYIQWNISNALW